MFNKLDSISISCILLPISLKLSINVMIRTNKRSFISRHPFSPTISQDPYILALHSLNISNTLTSNQPRTLWPQSAYSLINAYPYTNPYTRKSPIRASPVQPMILTSTSQQNVPSPNLTSIASQKWKFTKNNLDSQSSHHLQLSLHKVSLCCLIISIILLT